MRYEATQPLDQLYARAREEAKAGSRDVHVAEVLKTYLEYCPEDGRAWFLYGDSLRELGRNREAVSALRKAYRKSPSEYGGYVAIHLAMILKEHRSPVAAKKWFALGTKRLGTAVAWPWILAGVNHFALGDMPAAVEAFDIAARTDAEERDEALLNLALTHQALGDYSEAARQLKRCIRIAKDPSHARALLRSLETIKQTRQLVKKTERLLHQVRR